MKSSGTVQVSFLQENFSTHTFTVLASQAFTAGQLSGNTQIEFDLAHVANATAITGSFELINGNTVTSSTTFSDSGQQGQIFTDGVNWTRAGIGSFSPSVVTISGAAKEGQTLAANAATNDADATIHYQWQKSTDNFAHVQTIGTDSSSYVVQEADEGAKIHVVVTTSDSDNTSRASVSVTSAATGTVGDITLAFSTAASISGAATAKEGTALTAVNGTLNDSDASVTGYQWQTSADGSTGWTDIAGATTSTYTPVEGDEGKFLHVVETATDSDGGPAITSTSAATSAVADITPALSGVSISGTAQEGQTLTANGTVNDSDATIGYQWQSSSDGTHWSNIANAGQRRKVKRSTPSSPASRAMMR